MRLCVCVCLAEQLPKSISKYETKQETASVYTEKPSATKAAGKEFISGEKHLHSQAQGSQR